MRHFVMIFKDREKLKDMLEMRKQGWTYESLAIIFGVDHSSIYKACKIRGIVRIKEPISIDLSLILNELGIKPREEKSYQDYLEEQHRRKFPKLYAVQTTV